MDFAALIERAVSFVLWFLKLYAVGTFLGLFSFRQVEKRDAQLVALRKENAELRASADLEGGRRRRRRRTGAASI